MYVCVKYNLQIFEVEYPFFDYRIHNGEIYRDGLSEELKSYKVSSVPSRTGLDEGKINGVKK